MKIGQYKKAEPAKKDSRRKQKSSKRERNASSKFDMGKRYRQKHEKAAPHTKQDKRKAKQCTDPGTTRRRILRGDINTWASPNGEQQRQIDYIAINQRCRGKAKQSYEVHKNGEGTWAEIDNVQ